MGRVLKIAFIEQDAGIGGAEINLFALLERIDRRRFEPVVILPYEGALSGRLRKMGVPFEVIPRAVLPSTSFYVGNRKIFNPLALLLSIFLFLPVIGRIRSFLRRTGIGLVHTNSIVAHVYGGLAARLAGVPCIWHMQDIIDRRMAMGLVHRLMVFLGRVLADRVVVVSKAAAEAFSGAGAGNIRIIHNGVDTLKFFPRRGGEAVREEWGIAAQAQVVGIIGRLTQWKGQREFLKAAALVLRAEPSVRFLVVGDTTFGSSGYKDELQRLTRQLGIEEKVVFTGGRDDIPELLGAMDILVHASVAPEPFGLVIIEAMASGVPVIASDSGGPREIIKDGLNGFLVDPTDTDSLAGIILNVLRSPALGEALAQAGRRRVEEAFGIERFTGEFERIYEEVAG